VGKSAYLDERDVGQVMRDDTSETPKINSAIKYSGHQAGFTFILVDERMDTLTLNCLMER